MKLLIQGCASDHTYQNTIENVSIDEIKTVLGDENALPQYGRLTVFDIDKGAIENIVRTGNLYNYTAEFDAIVAYFNIKVHRNDPRLSFKPSAYFHVVYNDLTHSMRATARSVATALKEGRQIVTIGRSNQIRVFGTPASVHLIEKDWSEIDKELDKLTAKEKPAIAF